jgi:hypothetical protein
MPVKLDVSLQYCVRVALQLFLLSETIKIIPSGVDKGAHNGTIGMSADCQKRG